MSTINSNPINTTTPHLMQKMQDQLAKADLDKNGSLSKDEIIASAPKEATQDKIDKMFARLDVDANGEISTEEQEAMWEQMTERMGSLSNETGFKGGQEMNAANSRLRDTLKQSIEEGSKPNSHDNTLSNSLKDFTQRYPRIDVQA